MSNHRSARVRVSNEAETFNIEARNAVEHLRSEMIEIEAIARAAEEAADGLPEPTTDRQRLAFGRLQSLTAKAARQAMESLEYAR